MLIEYVKNRKGRRIGVVVATAKEEIGYSLANEKAGDKFNSELGLAIAVGRAKLGTTRFGDLPHTVATTYENMLDRAERYYK